MKSLKHEIANLVVAQLDINGSKDAYCAWVAKWRKVHDFLVMSIHEHKKERRNYRSSFSCHHQSMAAKYGALARSMYMARALAKERHVPVIQKVAEPA